MDNGLPQSEKWLLLSGVLLLALLAAWHLFSARGLFHYFTLERQFTAVQQENVSLQTENETIAKEIGLLRNDKDYFINRVRKEYGLVKKNEVIFDFSKH